MDTHDLYGHPLIERSIPKDVLWVSAIFTARFLLQTADRRPPTAFMGVLKHRGRPRMGMEGEQKQCYWLLATGYWLLLFRL
jgi:hypothetical protein